MKISTFLLLLGVIISSVCSGQHNDETKIDKNLQAEWIKSASKELLKFKPDPSGEKVIPLINSAPGYEKISYRICGKGYIVADNQDWIYIVCSSSHDNEKIGDISIAVDNKKRIFINNGHICGGMIHFESNGQLKLTSSDHFFQSFHEDSYDTAWKKI